MKFNLILHGMMAVFPDGKHGDHLDICIPLKEMSGNEVHVAKIGQIFSRKDHPIEDLERGFYELNGLPANSEWRPGKPKSNLILKSSKAQPLRQVKDKIFAHLRVPKPKCSDLILRPINIDSVHDGDGVLQAEPTTLSEITVFQYGEIKDLPHLENGPSKFDIKLNEQRNVCNLIIYAEPKTKTPQPHFHLFTDMINVAGRPLCLNVAAKKNPPGPQSDADGISKPEQACHYAVEGEYLMDHGGCSLAYVLSLDS